MEKKTVKRESIKKLKERAGKVLEALENEYGDSNKCYLIYETDWQLLFSTIMSAQCTDARVNEVAEKLYKKYPDLEAFAKADYNELCEDIKSTGFFHSKAKNIKLSAEKLLLQYDGKVPSDIEELTKLPGVGRKTANVVRGHIFSIPSIVVDTHVKRVSRLLGLTDTDDPQKAEYELMELLPENQWIRWNTDIIAVGRTYCISGNPKCGECFLKDTCRYANGQAPDSPKSKIPYKRLKKTL